jgi:hypothetical protein
MISFPIFLTSLIFICSLVERRPRTFPVQSYDVVFGDASILR